MGKSIFSYECTNCKYHTPKWLGCCPKCNNWNCLVENQPVLNTSKNQATQPTIMKSLHAISPNKKGRMHSGINEWDRVLGNGIMPASLSIVTGDPGIGKSTLLLQISNALARNYRVYYFSTEESLEQVTIRTQRLQCIEKNLLFSDTSDLHSIVTTIAKDKPDLVVIDSIQSCNVTGKGSTPGNMQQLRETTAILMRLSKEQGVTVIVSGHITKEGTIAGPKLLEHMVDTVLYLKGEDRWQTRVLRSVKNRFGATNELGFFTMNNKGLEPVPNINKILLRDFSLAPGSVLVSTMEGTRPLLLELQALTVISKLAMPQRVIAGIDHKQVILIAAILEKYLQVKFSTHDIFFKISGAFKIKGSESDLGIAIALLSSYFQKSLSKKYVILGEISLTGQIKPVNHTHVFMEESKKFGITEFLIAYDQNLQKGSGNIWRFSHVLELLSLFPQ